LYDRNLADFVLSGIALLAVAGGFCQPEPDSIIVHQILPGGVDPRQVGLL
jgi:hypothetical protein